VASKDISQHAQVCRRRRVIALGLLLGTVLLVLAACGGSGASGGGTPIPTSGGAATPIPTIGGLASSIPTSVSTVSPVVTGSPAPGPNPYRQFDQDVARLLDRHAVWQAPKQINVDQTARVGLVIGDPSLLKTEIRQLVPGSYPKPAGNVKVGSTIGVQLIADPSDASVTPKDAIDNSMGEHTALLWTWYVNAKHPNPGLLLIAEVVTKMSDGHVLRRELPLTIPVDRTVQYTLYQIFSNWATWAAIVAAFGTAASWVWRRRKKQQRNGPTSGKPKNKKPKSKKPVTT
jgi:hypothetical protein